MSCLGEFSWWCCFRELVVKFAIDICSFAPPSLSLSLSLLFVRFKVARPIGQKRTLLQEEPVDPKFQVRAHLCCTSPLAPRLMGWCHFSGSLWDIRTLRRHRPYASKAVLELLLINCCQHSSRLRTSCSVGPIVPLSQIIFSQHLHALALAGRISFLNLRVGGTKLDALVTG